MFPRRLILFLSVLLALLPAMPAEALESFTTSELTIVTASGPQKFTVEMALTPSQMEQGLMFRRALAPNAGMLFDFKEPTITAMWMKNTWIPLDMLFADQYGRIVDIHERAVPESLDTIAPKVPARIVIELNGGTIARLGIRIGDKIVHPIFQTQS
jgi:uncharacterized membrane protein (UPF0127 family)